jgi:ABC-type Mn2+/Zn2+ transport system permease subunit
MWNIVDGVAKSLLTGITGGVIASSVSQDTGTLSVTVLTIVGFVLLLFSYRFIEWLGEKQKTEEETKKMKK